MSAPHRGVKHVWQKFTC